MNIAVFESPTEIKNYYISGSIYAQMIMERNESDILYLLKKYKKSLREEQKMRLNWKIGCVAATMIFGAVFAAPNMKATQVLAEETSVETTKPMSQWQKDGYGWKYYDSSGNLLSGGIKTVNGKEYYFGAEGYLQTGFRYVGNNIYYFSTNGQNPDAGLGVKNTSSGWKNFGGKIYYLTGGKVTLGWKTIGKNKYYFYNAGDLNSKGKMLIGFQKIGKYTYYFKGSGSYGIKGSMLKGWQTLNKKRYYFYSNGRMAKNTYIQGYQVTKSGALSKKAYALQKKVKSVVAKKTKKCKSKSAKLKACYKYVVKSFRYKRSYSFKKTKSWEMNYAYTMLTKKRGNCYNYAATFAFLAREVGYNAKSVTGRITAARGGFTPHSWVEIKMGKKTYLFDPEMQHAKGYNLYKKRYKSVGLTYKKK